MEPKKGAECAPKDNPLDKAVRNLPRQDAVAFDSSNGACKSEDPQKKQTAEKCSFEDRAPLFNTAVIPL
ncbi:MAG: hypothetical protein WB951_20685, partial [Candidatus Sulfotelmatobacter sp.]